MDALRLLSDGTPVTLADGSVVTVRFDFEGMMRLEVAFGSTLDFAKQLDARHRGRGFAAVLGGLQAGVRDRAITAADLAPKHLLTYRQALVAAWLEAMPEIPEDEGKAHGRSEDGTGPASTTSPPSDSDAPTESGAA